MCEEKERLIKRERARERERDGERSHTLRGVALLAEAQAVLFEDLHGFYTREKAP